MCTSFFRGGARTGFVVVLLVFFLTSVSATGKTKAKRTANQGNTDLQLQFSPVWAPSFRFMQSRSGNFALDQPQSSALSLVLGSAQPLVLSGPGHSSGLWTPLAAPATLINESWIGGTGDWNVASDWTPAGIPNNGTPPGTTYEVTIDSGGTDVVVLNMNTTIASLVLGGTTGSHCG